MILPYATAPSPSNRRAFIITPILGTVTGGLLGLVPYGAFCGLLGVGFGIGAACSYLASTRRVLFGVAGNVLAAAANLLVVAAQAGPSTRREELLQIAVVMLGFYVVPGLVGSLIVVRSRPPPAPQGEERGHSP